MCRIFGHLGGRASPHELRGVSAAQRHGGPDAQTTRQGPGWALGSNRLAIVDRAGGAQPYRLGDDLLVVFNGEIYNHDELRADLRRRGHRFPDGCDGSILPALYAEYGTAFTEHLDGMYATGVLDLRSAVARLILSTDGTGMKPLYYFWDERRGALYFSSELPALLAFESVSIAIWEPGLEEYLATRTPFGEQTMFEGVAVLPPATTLELALGSGPRLSRRPVRRSPARFEPAQGQSQDRPHGRDQGQALARAGQGLRELLQAEVARLLRADVPVAVITSGGLDSSLISALAARRAPGIHSFTIGYTGDLPFDERDFARQVAIRNGTVHHQVELDPADIPGLLADVVWHLGQPNADPITVSTYVLFAAVRAAGFAVALTGDGADEFFGGYPRVIAARRTAPGQPWIPRYVEALAAVPAPLRMRLYSADYAAFVRARGLASHRVEAELARSDRSAPSRATTVTEFETSTRMPAYHLRRVDHLSMASSVEVRVPFCQPAVTEYARGLAEELTVPASGAGKAALYAAAGGLLPDAVLRRPKQPFTLPITQLLAPGQPLYTVARDLLSADRIQDRGYLDATAVAGLFSQQTARPSDGCALALWSLLIHEIWLEQFWAGSPAYRSRPLTTTTVPGPAVAGTAA